MAQAIDQKRALSFKKSAELYDKVRPRYPSAWIRDLKKYTGVSENSRILEVGAGTGIATSDLLKISEHITCLDPGKEMLEIASRKFPNLEYINSTFEQYEFRKKFDLIVSAMAWHWVDPMKGYKIAHDFLKDPGHLAVIRYYHIDPDLHSFHNQAQHIYEKYSKLSKSKRHTEQLNQINNDAKAFINSFFKLDKKIEYKWQQDFSIEDYLTLRNTYSDHITMNPAQRIKMENELRQFANKEFSGKLTKKYTTVLFICSKKVH